MPYSDPALQRRAKAESARRRIGTPVAEITRKLGISEATFYVWKKRFGTLGTPEIRELRQLREENAKLKLLRREGWKVKVKRVARIYRVEGLAIRTKTPRRRRAALIREAPAQPTAMNQSWAMDFMHDVLADGSKIRLLTIVDTFCRESVALEVDFGFKAPQVVDVLRRVATERGKPQRTAITAPSSFPCTWTMAHWNGVKLDFSHRRRAHAARISPSAQSRQRLPARPADAENDVVLWMVGMIVQDVALQEGMGPVCDRSREHLAYSDAVIIATRRLLFEAMDAVARGRQPRAVDPADYRMVRGSDRLLDAGGDWRATLGPELTARFSGSAFGGRRL